MKLNKEEDFEDYKREVVAVAELFAELDPTADNADLMRAAIWRAKARHSEGEVQAYYADKAYGRILEKAATA